MNTLFTCIAGTAILFGLIAFFCDFDNLKRRVEKLEKDSGK